MAGPWEESSNPLLSGLFGILQQAAEQHLDTATLWSSLRQAAGTWQWQAQGGGELPPPEQLEETGRGILQRQGVGIQEVNTYRALAGQWRTAKQQLHDLGETDQVTAGGIFTPPWSQTFTGATPSRYRVRVQWNVEPLEGDAFTTWGSYELDSPLTSLGDILDQAGALVGTKPSSDMPLGALVTGAADYELEQI